MKTKHVFSNGRLVFNPDGSLTPYGKGVKWIQCENVLDATLGNTPILERWKTLSREGFNLIMNSSEHLQNEETKEGAWDLLQGNIDGDEYVKKLE